MKEFLKKMFFWVLLLLIIHLTLGFFADGATDPFYLRFASPKQTSLIIGTSRAAQGIVPHLLDSIIPQCGNGFYNFAFTIAHSPFGPVYLNAIKSKLRQAENCQGTHIVTIDPWSIATANDAPNDILLFKENKLALGNTKFYSFQPNYFYLINNYKQGWFNLLKRSNKSIVLDNNGWLSISLPMDQKAVSTRTKNKVANYKNQYLPKYKLSEVRVTYLIETIEYLKTNGDVFVVRLPISDEILNIENLFMPEFNILADSICNNLEVEYIDLSVNGNKFRFTDGNHLYKESSKDLSIELGGIIKGEG